MIVKVSVKNIDINSMDFNIPPVISTISGNVPVSVNSTLPPEIKSVDKVYFYSPPTISFDLKALSLPTMINKTVKIDALSIHFPDEFVFEPALPGNTYTLTNEVLTNPRNRPIKWCQVSGSYSFMHSKFKTFGFALNLSPGFINLFLACDYLVFKRTPQFIPLNTSTTNFQLGLAIPLGK